MRWGLLGGRASIAIFSAVVSLSGCGPDDPISGAQASRTAPRAIAGGVSLSVDPPSCSPSGEQKSCSLSVWYVNETTAPLVIDARYTFIVDSDGVWRHGDTVGAVASLKIAANDRVVVVWDVLLPSDATLTGVQWTAEDGTTAEVLLGAGPWPSSTSSRSAGVTPVPTLTATPTVATPPVSTPTSTPTPTQSGPTGSIG